MRLQWVITVECDDRYDVVWNLIDDIESMLDVDLPPVVESTDIDGNVYDVPVAVSLEFAP